jgi:hypothetical protein
MNLMESFDQQPVFRSAPDDLNKTLLEGYLRRVRGIGLADLPVPWTDWLLYLNVLTQHNGELLATVAGMLLFGREPRRFLPQVGLRLARFKGQELRNDRLIDRQVEPAGFETQWIEYDEPSWLTDTVSYPASHKAAANPVQTSLSRNNLMASTSSAQQLFRRLCSHPLAQTFAPGFRRVGLQALVYRGAMVLIIAQSVVNLGQREMRQDVGCDFLRRVASLSIAHDHVHADARALDHGS